VLALRQGQTLFERFWEITAPSRVPSRFAAMTPKGRQQMMTPLEGGCLDVSRANTCDRRGDAVSLRRILQ
jgi:hypothetical protein